VGCPKGKKTAAGGPPCGRAILETAVRSLQRRPAHRAQKKWAWRVLLILWVVQGHSLPYAHVKWHPFPVAIIPCLAMGAQSNQRERISPLLLGGGESGSWAGGGWPGRVRAGRSWAVRGLGWLGVGLTKAGVGRGWG
jgi:hypothetical protein